MECNSETPVSTLKVDFGCTRNCPTDVKNMLEQLKGVKSISIDPNQGKVTVVGNVNPMMLIKLLQRMGKKAQLWSFDKAPLQKNAGSHPKFTQKSHCCCESSDSENDSDTDFHDSCSSCRKTQHTARHDRRSDKMHSQKNQFGSTYKHAAAPATTGYHPQMQGYQPYAGYNFPMQYQPFANARPVPWYGSYGRVQPMSSRFWPPHYDSRLLQQHSPMIHYTSYADNYHYTL